MHPFFTPPLRVCCCLQYPDVPKLFVWEDPLSGKDVIALEHPHGYGGITQKDCARTRGGVALCYSFRTDNSGPPAGVDEVITDLDTVRKEFPDASVFASTYDKCVSWRGYSRVFHPFLCVCVCVCLCCCGAASSTRQCPKKTPLRVSTVRVRGGVGVHARLGTFHVTVPFPSPQLKSATLGFSE